MAAAQASSPARSIGSSTRAPLMGDAHRILELATTWRDRAATLRRYGATGSADALEACSAELITILAAEAEAPLTLDRAASECGYSADHLGRLVREGSIPNRGQKGAPRIARGDLPRKSGAMATVTPIREIDRTQIVRSAVRKGAA